MAELSKTLPVKGKKNVLITSALPYVNNVPHLGNLIGCVLSADVFARFCKQRGLNTLYVCGTDEYGTATETKARQENCHPREICSKYWKLHKEIYDWFQIDFDYFGRTSTEKQTEIAQGIFLDLHKRGFFVGKVIQQFYCKKCEQFLADRYVTGTCPSCKYVGTRGDQCEKCDTLFNAIELEDAHCSICKSIPEIRESKHLFLDLPKLVEDLKTWVGESIENGDWSNVAKSVTRGWIKEGIQERCITRDLTWGTKVPLEEYKDKVFYVWFDAPIGYISITANYTEDWKKWWIQEDEDVNIQYYQFLAKDNVPFHSIVFPSTLLGTGRKWTLVNGLRSTHYLNYEDKKFSKTYGIGVFGNDVKETGIPCEVWRYYLLTNRPEQQDTQFFWSDLSDKNNNELLKNLGNFINRALKFCCSRFDSKVPKLGALTERDNELKVETNKLLKKYIEKLEGCKLKDGVHVAMLISKLGNLYMQDNKPWELAKEDPERCATVVNLSVQLVCLLAAIFQPYTPNFTKKVQGQLNVPEEKYMAIPDVFNFDSLREGHVLGTAEPIFGKISLEEVKKLRKRFGGQLRTEFKLDLRVGCIKEVKTVENRDHAYQLLVDIGQGDDERTIGANIRKFYKPEELVGKKVIVIVNLKPKDFGGVFQSHGMLLAERKKKNLKLLAPPDDQIELGTNFAPEKHTLSIEPALVPKELKGILKTVKVGQNSNIHIEEAPFVAIKEDQVFVLKSQIGKGAKII